LCWPGWLQAVPHERHRVAWQVQPDPSLRHVAEGLRQWREQFPPAPDEHTFASHPDVANYCAWFCPDVRLGRQPWPLPDEPGVTTLVVYDTDLPRLFAAVHRVVRAGGDQWALCRIDGRALVFRRRTGAVPARPHCDPARLAFAAGDDDGLGVAPR